ncbi:uncharacterized protein LOC119381172 [Rhipicephalus sanguineus]|uniref:Secreted protein n=1 Tax=Rhipicephalus sanguineus TaxID=34632 RepID=A0A9D4T3N8_RHISA|nr:uncharacterized protein LOC119381172 [Rhipicephalus sanguineus]KAH7968894.1 hypothetical protein HPB52_012281 [Rhipicephalus sanguineus]
MTPLPCLAWIALLVFTCDSVVTGRPIRNGTATTVASTNRPTTLVTSPTTESYEEQPPPWRQSGSLADGVRHHPSLTLLSFDPGCRKRVFCEAARTLTYAFPLSRSWHGEVRERPVPTNEYFAAWSKGLLGHDCSHLYQDCSDSPAGWVMPLVREAIGPRGFVGAFIERLAAASVRHAIVGHGAPPRPSLVMEKLRKGERRLADAVEPPMPSIEFTPR